MKPVFHAAILITTFFLAGNAHALVLRAHIFGCLPLWFASGSGAVARRVLGSTVIGGMIAASGIAIFLIPVTFYVIERLAAGRQTAAHSVEPEQSRPA